MLKVLLTSGVACLVCSTLLLVGERGSRALIISAYRFNNSGDGKFADQIIGTNYVAYILLIASVVLIGAAIEKANKQ